RQTLFTRRLHQRRVSARSLCAMTRRSSTRHMAKGSHRSDTHAEACRIGSSYPVCHCLVGLSLSVNGALLPCNAEQATGTPFAPVSVKLDQWAISPPVE